MNLAALRSLLASALLLFAGQALAQGTFNDAVGASHPGTVQMCIDANGKASPVGAGLPCPGANSAVFTTPTVQNAAYSSGNAAGGLQTIPFFRSAQSPSGILNNISVSSKGGSTAPITFYIFTSNPSASTCTDKVAFVLNAADVSKLIPTTPPVLTPAVVGAGTTMTFASQQLPISVQNLDSPAVTSLYVCAVVGASVTPASTTDLVFKYAGIQD